MIILPSVSSGIISSSFSPTRIKGLKLWVKADADVTVTGGVVTSWKDQSGSTNNLSNQTANSVLESNIINGNPAIKFDSGRLSGNDIVTTKTIYAVIKTLQSQPSQYAAILEATGGSLYSAIDQNTWGSYFSTGGGGERPANTTIAANTAAIIATLSDNGQNYIFRLNGQQDGNGTDGLGFYSRSALYVGNDSGGGQQANVYISEILVFDNVISAQNIAILESYLNNKYRIY